MRFWTAEHDEELKTLHASGVSYRTMSTKIAGGIYSRCACMGRAKRLGLAMRATGSAGKVPTVRQPALRQATQDGLTIPEPIGPLETFGENHTCRWIHGDPAKPGWRTCGHPAPEGPWCPAHERLAYPQGHSPSEVRAARQASKEAYVRSGRSRTGLG